MHNTVVGSIWRPCKYVVGYMQTMCTFFCIVCRMLNGYHVKYVGGYMQTMYTFLYSMPEVIWRPCKYVVARRLHGDHVKYVGC